MKLKESKNINPNNPNEMYDSEVMFANCLTAINGYLLMFTVTFASACMINSKL